MGESRSERIERLFEEIRDLDQLADRVEAGELAITRREHALASRRIQQIITELEAMLHETSGEPAP